MASATATAPPPASTAEPARRLERRNYGRGHGYKLDGEKIIGVTTVIDSLDKPALRRWYAEEAAKRVVDEWDRIVGMRPSERLSFVKDGPKDTVRAAALRGTQIHALGDKLVHGEPVDVPDEHRGPVEAYARWLDRWQITPLASETPCANTTYRYAGTADLWGHVGVRDDELALLDIKTGKGVWSEVGLQLAAYRYSDLIQVAGEEQPTPEVSRVYVAHVLPDTVRTVPVEAGPDIFRTFLYLQQVHQAVKGWQDFPLVGEEEQP